jgi:transcriptional regulator with XRE-family HTH domain
MTNSIREKMSEVEKTSEFQLESLILEFTDRIQDRMGEIGMSRARLARMLGVSRARITNMLKGDGANFTLRTMVEAANALGLKISIDLSKASQTQSSDAQAVALENRDGKNIKAGKKPETKKRDKQENWNPETMGKSGKPIVIRF